MALVTVIALPQGIIMSHLAALMDGESVPFISIALQGRLRKRELRCSII
jgi:hypothetical protein